jgi:hypothetical protein
MSAAPYPSPEELGRQIGTLQKQLTRLRLQSLHHRAGPVPVKRLQVAIAAATAALVAQPYNHYTASDLLDDAEALADRFLHH